jgi:hypothetical protein
VELRYEERSRQSSSSQKFNLPLTVLLQCQWTISFSHKNDVFSSAEDGMMMVEKNETLRRQSMELLKELTEILQRIIGSGDQQSLSRLRETMRTLHESRHKAADRLH